jgi:bifunctional non-homologous end joining protein LigD
MKLAEYNKKRDFNKTKEPKGKIKKGGKQLHFVIQKHAASHLHFDFRLEIDGVLVSWAVPKGPSADPSVKRLAMHVEDHPMDYIDFEGTIPQGEYGGGTVMVWDTGTYLAEGSNDVAESEKMLRKMHKEGNIKIVLSGKKLMGSYHLVQMHGKDKEWLLMKAKDEYADKKAFDQKSVLTGRTLEEISGDKKSDVWQSDHKNNKSSKKNILEDVEESTKPEIDNGFTANDVADAKKLKVFPNEWKPQLATLGEEIPEGRDWIYETKYDGYRALVMIDKQKTELVSRNGLSFNKKYAPLLKAFSGIKDDIILDGEIVVEDDKGISHFQWLQYFAENPDRGKLKIYVFDILYFNGFDLTPLTLLQRKKILKALLPQSDEIIYSDHINNGKMALAKVKKAGGEGLIAKKADSTYHINKRSKDWLKIKVTKEQEMVVGGFTDPKGSRTGFGSLLLGYYKDGSLIYSGKVGTGFNEDSLADLHEKLKKLERKTSPFKSVPHKLSKSHWISPELVAQIKYSEWTETNSLRHPVFIALRNDKDAEDVVKEISSLTPKGGTASGNEKKPAEKSAVKPKAMKEEKSAAEKKDVPKKTTTKEATVTKKAASKTATPKTKKGWDTDKVEVTHPEKVFWPEQGITKGDVIKYYDEMADYILPYIKDRPQSMRRTPDGIVKEGFFQKNVAGMVPDWAVTEKIHSESTKEDIEFLICNDKETLIYMANLGCIEINPWSSRVGALDNPDYIIFDLDPNQVGIKELVITAKKVKEVLDSLGIKGYLKTSGGKGLHVFIPIKPKYTYEQSRDFSHIISQHVHAALPDITSLERMPKKRIGKVYLDFLQNGKGKTMACAYSLRPREGATASTPLEWDELTSKFDLKKYNIKTLPKRVKSKGDLWADFFDNAIDLGEVLGKIG